MTGLPTRDLDHILSRARELWEDLRGGAIFFTGCTGFVGMWLMESLLCANDKLDLGVSVVGLTRNPERFREKAPHLASHPPVRRAPAPVYQRRRCLRQAALADDAHPGGLYRRSINHGHGLSLWARKACVGVHVCDVRASVWLRCNHCTVVHIYRPVASPRCQLRSRQFYPGCAARRPRTGRGRWHAIPVLP